MDGAFVLYVNHPNNKATIHATICGKFVSRRRDKTLNGYWSTVEHEPFKALRDAEEYAKKRERKTLTNVLSALNNRTYHPDVLDMKTGQAIFLKA
jgi:hypothetical protein